MATDLSEVSFADITQIEPYRLDQRMSDQKRTEQKKPEQTRPGQTRPELIKYVISGVINFSTVQALSSKITKICESYNRSASTGKKSETGVELDFSQVTQCNSAGLALVLEMSKTARTNNITLHYKNFPDSLLSIAKAYGVECEIRELGK